jgi:hypothetical protein
MPPTFETSSPFQRDFTSLPSDHRDRFRIAVGELVADLKDGRTPRPGLRIKGVQGAPGVFEMTYAPDGRATFQYGSPVRKGEAHIVWRRIGTHGILKNP